MENKNEKKLDGFLGFVEKAGNKIPHPVVLFIALALIVIVVSAIGEAQGWNVTYFDGRKGEEATVAVTSLMNAEGLNYMFNSAVKNFTGFTPVGTVLVAIMGVGVAEASGLINTGLKKVLLSVNPSFLTAVVVFVGIMSNVADASGYVVVIPIGAMMFAAAGRHPIAGLTAAFSGVSGGFSANLLISPTDAVLAGITNEALNAVGTDYTVAATGNWFFLIASTFLITTIGTIITEKIVEPRLGTYTGDYTFDHEPVTELESRGIRNAGISLLIFAVIMGILMFAGGDNAIFKSAEADGTMTLNNFLNNGLLPMILLAFAIPGIAYGKTVGTMKTTNQIVAGMSSGIGTMNSYLVLVFFAAQFISYFNYTKIGTIVAVNGAEFLRNINFVGIPLIISFVMLSGFLNLFMGSASAKWAIMAPIFVPMMFSLNISPELTQIAYRIGDSSTNIITPLMSYFAAIVAFAQRYDKSAGIGTLISNMLPYSLSYLILWSLFLVIWIFIGLPLGPGVSLFL
ncbi:MAG: TIGR00366 family protein [Tissierellia bacterium]|nr:TIGR00366 family protein [Tissierellia bacterium]